MGGLFKAANLDAIDVLINLDVGQLRRALKMFAGKAADADVAVVYYAGHGIEVGETADVTSVACAGARGVSLRGVCARPTVRITSLT